MHYTIEGDAIITDYQYDGNMFTVTHDATRDNFGVRATTTYKFKYLVPLDRSNTAFEQGTFFLSNEENIFTGAIGGQNGEEFNKLIIFRHFENINYKADKIN